MEWTKTAFGYEATTPYGTYRAERMRSGRFLLTIEGAVVGKGDTLANVKSLVNTIDANRAESARIATENAKLEKANGVILYRGPSQFNGAPIVVVATGLLDYSANKKTGEVIPVYILPDTSMTPNEAIKAGTDASVCGDCIHRSPEQTAWEIRRAAALTNGLTFDEPRPIGKLGSCYVNCGQGSLAIHNGIKRGIYPTYDSAKHDWLIRGRNVRFGAYGDPAAVPIEFWSNLDSLCGGREGYTHAWRTCPPTYAKYCMASVETPTQRAEAIAKGYRTFRVRLEDQPLEKGEFSCPASVEAGYRLTCDECRACSGAKDSPRAASPSIIFHGSPFGGFWKLRIYKRSMEKVLAQEKTKRFALQMA